jgi:predicted double-glycine peptidase
MHARSDSAAARYASHMKRDAKRYRRIPDGAIKIDLPNTTQITDYTCGASALLAVCSYFGVGPEDEWDVEADMGFGRAGSDPEHFRRAARKYGLRLAEYRGMTQAQLVECLDAGRPVIVMLQAWPDRRTASYANRWDDGHWVVAIGYDAQVFYFEDPSIHGGRGFIHRRELASRWHDIEGPRKERVFQLGIAVWASRISRFGSSVSARHID